MKFRAEEKEGIWTVRNDEMPIGRALTKSDAANFVDALNGMIGDELRDRIIAKLTDVVEQEFER